MNRLLVLRLLGIAIFLALMALIVRYEIQGVAIPLILGGFAVAWELVIVRPFR